MTSDRVHLRQDGVSVLIRLSEQGLPRVAHWGADLGPLTAADADTVDLADRAPVLGGEPGEPTWVSVLPEHTRGWRGRPGLSGSREGRGWSPRWTVTGFTVDASARDTGVVEARAVVVDAVDETAGLSVQTWFELLPGGLLRLRAELTNTGDDDYRLDDLVLALPVPTRARELLDLTGRATRERSPQRLAWGTGSWVREGRHGRTGTDAATVLHAGEPGFGFDRGEVWGVHVAWSGNHTHYAERLWTGAAVLGGGERLWPGEVRLAPGASYTSPWLYGSHGVGLDAVARRFHRWLRSRPEHVDTERPVTLNTWEAVYFDQDPARLLALAERAADVGVERFVLDDGWFGARRTDRAGLGDWQVSTEVWPQGLHPLVDRVRALGMQFGLWCEPEMINVDSDLARAHPDWILRTDHDHLPLEARHQQVLDLALPACYDHVRSALQRLLDEYEIGYLKWDHNRDLIDAGTGADHRPGTHDQTLAVYRLMAQLKADNPGLEIESCAGGGGRIDLAVLQHTDRVWVSDCIDPHERQLINRWTGQLLPPELLGSHIASTRSQTTGRRHDLGYRAATALFGHLGIEWDLTTVGADDLAELAAWIAYYQRHRAFLFGGDVVRLDPGDEALHAHGVLAPDRRRALISWSALDRSPVTWPGRLRVPELRPEVRYRVRPVFPGVVPAGLGAPPWFGAPGPDGEYPGVELTGRALGTVGLRPPLLHPDSTVLIDVSVGPGGG